MTDIPDDVVERALNIALERKSYKRGELTLEEYEYAKAELHEIGRVFVEWEREQCAAIASGYNRYSYVQINADGTWGPGSPYDRGAAYAAEIIAAAIRARSEGEG